MNPVLREPMRFSDRVCFVCACPATELGVAPNDKSPIAWICGDEECIQIAKDTYKMDPAKFRRLDSLAAQEGGDAGGEYLAEIGQFDLAELTDEQRCEFFRRVVGGYRVALKTTLRDESPF